MKRGIKEVCISRCWLTSITLKDRCIGLHPTYMSLLWEFQLIFADSVLLLEFQSLYYAKSVLCIGLQVHDSKRCLVAQIW